MARAQKQSPETAPPRSNRDSRSSGIERHAEWQHDEEVDLERLDNEGGFHGPLRRPGHKRSDEAARRRPHLSRGEAKPHAEGTHGEPDPEDTSPFEGGHGYGLGFSYGVDRDNMTGGSYAGYEPPEQAAPGVPERERRAPRKRPLPRKPRG
jgi:hypothetical protein